MYLYIYTVFRFHRNIKEWNKRFSLYIFGLGKSDRSCELNGQTDFLAKKTLILSRAIKETRYVIVDRYRAQASMIIIINGESKLLEIIGLSVETSLCRLLLFV